jgi:putative endopeptidase
MHCKCLSLILGVMLGHAALAAPVPLSGIDPAGFDPRVRIQDDLYLAVNGHWEQTTMIPADQPSYGTFNQLRDLSESRSRTLIEQAQRQHARTADEKKITDLYQSFMQEQLVEAKGTRPIATDLERIMTLQDITALTRALGRLQGSIISLPLRVSVQPDAHNASAPLLRVSQGGLGLPGRDYYLLEDAAFVAARQAYVDYLTTLFALGGFSRPAQRAQSVLMLETRLARAQWRAEDNRDPQKTFNRVTRSQLESLAPELPWQQWLSAAGLSSVTQLNLAQPGYVREFGRILVETPLALWRDYLRARTLSAYAPYLTHGFAGADFRFHQQALSGVKQQSPRWKRGVSLVEHSMGMALGKLYVAHYFPPEHKIRVQELVDNLMRAYRQSIDSLDWMTPATKKQALIKLSRYQVKIGYPEQWRDYHDLRIRPDDLVGNLQRIAAFEYQDTVSRLGRPVDRSEWHMTPQTVNAYYSAQLNEIVFPAAILQPPFFNPQADDAVNYGAIGAVIGHEISHGFDDQGSQYDGEGKLRDWWSAEDRSRFRQRAEKLQAQYAAYEPLPGHHVNGKLTLGENIADNAGLQIAYKAYQLSLHGRSPQILDGLSGDMRFFIGFARIWRNKMQDAQLLKQLVSNPHTPAHFRPRGAAVNSDAFYQAFDVKPQDGMYLPKALRVQLW